MGRTPCVRTSSQSLPVLLSAAPLAEWVQSVDPASDANRLPFDPLQLSAVIPGLEASSSLRIAHELLTCTALIDDAEEKDDEEEEAGAASVNGNCGTSTSADQLLTLSSPTANPRTPFVGRSPRTPMLTHHGRSEMRQSRRDSPGDALIRAAASPSLSPSSPGHMARSNLSTRSPDAWGGVGSMGSPAGTLAAAAPSPGAKPQMAKEESL